MPRMSQFDAERDPVEVLAEDFAERLRRGERPSIADYVKRYPELADQIEALFPALLLVEEAATEEYSVRRSAGGRSTPLQSLRVERLGDYRIVREIGRGGMGIVYEAVQESLGRRVALKALPPGVLADTDRQRRFEREAQAAARLHHTNIVPVFGVGEQGDVCYYVMQYIDGRPLERVLRETPRERLADPAYWRWVAAIGLQVAQALDYAHHQGTLHRDIKPANLLLDEQGSVWITDFGVALLSQEEGLTQVGDVVGTLRYMAPEQLSGQADARSDLYSLGLTIYELLALRPAFAESNRTALVRQIADGVAPPLRRHSPSIPRDLETIVAKATSREPQRRYQAAAELADDLQRFLDQRPIRARRVTWLEQLWLWCRRNRMVAALSAVAVSGLILAAVMGWLGYLSTNRALQRVREEADRAEDNLELSLDALEEVFNRVTGPEAGEAFGADRDLRLPAPVAPSEKDATLLEGMLRFYERFVARNEGNQRLQADMARAHRRVGQIEHRLGRPEKAEAAIRRSLATYKALANASKDSRSYSTEMAAAYNRLGLVLETKGRFDLASQEAYEKVPTLLAGSDADASRYQLIQSYNSLGRLALGGRALALLAGRPSQGAASPEYQAALERSQDYHQKALELAKAIVASSPQNADFRSALALTYRHLAFLLLHRDQVEEALRENEVAVRILEELTREHPAVPQYQYDLAETCAMLATPWLPAAKIDQVIKDLEKAGRVASELAAASPRVPEYSLLVAKIASRHGVLLARQGRWQEAIRLHQQAIAVLKPLVDRYPSTPTYAVMLSISLQAVGGMHGATQQLAAARSELKQAAALLEGVLRTMGSPPLVVRAYLRQQYQSLARVLEQLGDQPAADQAAEKASKLSVRPGRP
jgi:tetratricopeptide (TPR) repeat protein